MKAGLKFEKVKDVTSKDGGTFGFEKLLPGNYLLKETNAATGYSLVTEPWKIVIDNNGEVTVTKNDGETAIAKNSEGDICLKTQRYIPYQNPVDREPMDLQSVV